ncbi:MAG: hypothetical protein ABIJ65_14185 [Chloroflexota bacterium]
MFFSTSQHTGWISTATPPGRKLHLTDLALARLAQARQDDQVHQGGTNENAKIVDRVRLNINYYLLFQLCHGSTRLNRLVDGNAFQSVEITMMVT